MLGSDLAFARGALGSVSGGVGSGDRSPVTLILSDFLAIS